MMGVRMSIWSGGMVRGGRLLLGGVLLALATVPAFGGGFSSAPLSPAGDGDAHPQPAAAVHLAAAGLPESPGGNVGALLGNPDSAWHSAFHGPGVDGTVRASVVWDDGSGPALYVGGEFSTAGDRVANGVARWDGERWTVLAGSSGVGVSGGSTPLVNALAVYDGDLIVGGSFTTAGGVTADNIARWDGSEWSALGSGTDNRVEALLGYDGALIAGGWFEQAGGVTVNRVGRWNGSEWSPLEGPSGTGTNNLVHSLAEFRGELLVGGSFFQAGGVTVSNIARWDGSEWMPLSGSGGTGTTGRVNDMVVHEGSLYVGGGFVQAGGIQVNRVAAWDGDDWSALGAGIGDGFTNEVNSLAVFDGEIIAGGVFSDAGDVAVENLAGWDGSAWRPVTGIDGGGADAKVLELALYDDRLIAGGEFSVVGGAAGNGIAAWDGNQWQSLAGPEPAGLGDSVLALAVHDGELIAGGDFVTAGDAMVNHIARWDGHRWAPLPGPAGTGMDEPVMALAVHDGDLYAGGEFTTAGGVVVNGIARWDGSQWSALTGPAGTGIFQSTGTNPHGWVDSLLSHDGGLYAGGDFVYAGGIEANSIARWDGAEWSALGGGVFNPGGYAVNVMTVFGGNLYAGGSFSQAGGVVVNGVARWDGSQWSALAGPAGTGMNSPVFALDIYDGALIAGGTFNLAGGVSASQIARWDGSQWSALGTGMSGGLFVGSLAVFDGDLIAAGSFTHAGASAANHIARWDGSAWHALSGPLGNGLNQAAFELAHFADGGPDWITDKVMAGGGFELSGGVVNWRLAAYGPRSDLAITPGRLDFGPVQTGATRGPLGVRVRNIGPDPVTVDSISGPGAPFAAAGGDCGTPPFSLQPDQACTLAFEFSPASAGPAAAEVTLDSDAAGAPHIFTLTGNGSGQALHTAPDPVDFGSAAVGDSAGPRLVTLSNTSSNIHSVTAVTVPAAPFDTAGGSCGPAPFALGPFAECTLAYTFTPAASGVSSFSVEITSDAPGDPAGFELQGQGLERALTLAPNPLNFGSVPLGSTGAVLGVTLDNPGEAIVNVDQVSAPAAPFFRAGGTCGPAPFSLPAGASCTLDYAFSPEDTGAFETTVEIAGDAPDSPQTLTLVGNGIGPLIAFSPAAVDFGAQTAGDSAEVTVTLTNPGNAGLTIEAIATPAAPFTLTGSGDCAPPQTLGPGGECTLGVGFEPDALGAYDGSIQVTSNAFTSPDAIELSGVAFDATQGKLVASDGESFSAFGIAVAMEDDTLVVGANSANAVYVFTRDGDGWSEQATLTPADPDGFLSFGAAVALAGDTLLVGAPSESVDGNNGQGAAYVFTRDGGSWSQQARLTVDDGQPFDNAGRAVALSGNTALVGTEGVDIDGNNNQGAAYVFTRDDGSWSQQAQLTAGDGLAFDNLGSAVALGDDFALVGARGVNVDGNNGQGAVYVFTRDGGTWSEQTRLVADDGGGFDNLGASLALSGETMLVGASGASVGGQFGRGAAYVFTRDGDGWSQQAKLVSTDGANGDAFGRSVALDGDTAVVGAWQADVDGNGNQGAAYVFTRDGGTWTQRTRLTAVDGAEGDQLGGAAALAAGTAAVGAPNADVGANDNQGAVYVFDLDLLVPEPALALDPESLDFGPVEVGETSPALSLTVQNTGLAGLEVEALDAPGAGFAAAGGSCGAAPFTLAPEASCTLSYTFTPDAPGPASTGVGITSNAASGPDAFELTGEGLAPTGDPGITVDPGAIDFGAVTVGETAGPEFVTITSTGEADLEVTSVGAPDAPFATAGGTCDPAPFTLAPEANCTLGYAFAPDAEGDFDSVVDITSNADAATVALSGEGVNAPAPELEFGSGLEMDFGDVPAGSATVTELVITNTGDAVLELEEIVSPGAPFQLLLTLSVGGPCGAPPLSMEAGESCAWTVRFEPPGTGVYTGEIVVISNAPSSPDTVALRGRGVPDAMAIPVLNGPWLLLLIVLTACITGLHTGVRRTT